MILPTAYLPPISYMSECVGSVEVVIEANETYLKQTCRNHCSILGPNGKQTLSIPVIKVNGNHTMTRDIRILNLQPWQKIHWRSIETAYNNAPFFIYYRDIFLPFYSKSFSFLLDFNRGLLEVIFSALKIERPIRNTDKFIKYQNSEGQELLVSKKSGFLNPPYRQVFHERTGFIPNLSVIDCLFNLGPETSHYLSQCGIQILPQPFKVRGQ